MAQLKIDVIVDDHGAAKTLTDVERSVKGIEQAAGATTNAVQKNSSSMAAWSASAGSFVRQAGALYVALGADRLVGALANAASEAFRSAGALTDLAAKSGLSVTTLQKLDFVGMQAGVSMERFADAAFMVGVRLGQGSKGVVRAVEELGLNFQALRAMNPDEQMNAILTALSKQGSEQDRNRLGVELFGRTFKSISAAVTSDYQAMADAAHTSSADQVSALDRTSDAWDRFIKNRKADFASLMGSLVLSAENRGVLGLLQNVGARLHGGLDVSSLEKPDLTGEAANNAMFEASIAAREKARGGTSAPSKTTAQLEAEEREAERRAKEAAIAAKKWADELDKLSGREAIKVADDWLKKLEQIGGVTLLAAKHQKTLNQAMEDGIEAMLKRGDLSGAPGMLEAGNIDLFNQPEIRNSDGSISTVKSFSVNLDGAEVVLPTVMADGRGIVSQEEAIQNYFNTGKHLGKFDTPEHAIDFAEKLHDKYAEGLYSAEKFASLFNTYVRTMQVEVTRGLSVLPGTKVTPPSVTGYYSNTMPQAVKGFPWDMPGTEVPMAGLNPLENVGFFQQAFGTGKQLGAQLGQAILGGIQGGWKGIVGNIGSMLGGNIGSQLGGMLSEKGGILGGLSGMLGPLGSMLGGMLSSFVSKLGGTVAKWFGRGDDGDKERDVFLEEMGGFTALSERLHHELGAEGDKMFAGLRNANSGAEITAAADKIKEALEAHAEAIKGAMETLPSAVIARSANITSQADVDTVGAEAMGSFSFLVQNGQSAIQAFEAIAPAVAAMKTAFADNNFEMSAASQRLIELGGIIEANKVQFDNIAASGSILSAMTQANIKDFGLFSAAATDVGTNLQAIIDNGVPTAQALAMSQPQLQALWEAQQKFGFETDASTQALIDQAETQGIVGLGMKDVNQKILDVLILIGDALGATIPDALRGLPEVAGKSVDDMNVAFARVRPPRFDFSSDGYSEPRGGSDGGDTRVVLELDGEVLTEAIVPRIPAAVDRYGI